MNAASSLLAVCSYEFRMQIRRRSVWLVLGLLGAYMLRVLVDQHRTPDRLDELVPEWAWLLQVLCPIAVGVLLADRSQRDRRTQVHEILESTPAADWLRLLGKYLGATAATIVPILLVYGLGLFWLAGHGDTEAVVRLAIPSFALICLPGLLFVAAYSVCVPVVMKVPLYQFLFVGYWFWGNLMPPQVMPTLRDTWLAPIGTVAQQSFFGIFNEGLTPDWQPVDGVISVSLLLAGAVAALVAGVVVLRWQRSRA
jgi:ABC-2 type transport system permease protein